MLFVLQILVIANPANTNALMLKEHAPSIPSENITALTRLDHNRALAQVRDSCTAADDVGVRFSSRCYTALSRLEHSRALARVGDRMTE
jgi:hypothetical protein